MSVNSSSSSFDQIHECSDFRNVFFIGTAFIAIRTFLLLPLSILVLYLGYRGWRQQCSFATTSHSDIFTYNLAAMELIFGLGVIVYICGGYIGQSAVRKIGQYVSLISFPGQMCFHVLTCGERYLAVVHPVTYMGLRQSGGVKIRNISTICVWLLCFGWCGVQYVLGRLFMAYICSLVFALIVVSFCSLRVLCVLIRPGPGEVGGVREWIDQSKQRAFHTIMAIMGVLWLWFAGFLVCLVLSEQLTYHDGCIVLACGYWFTLPSSLVLPLLFLHRAGKLHCCH